MIIMQGEDFILPKQVKLKQETLERLKQSWEREREEDPVFNLVFVSSPA